MGYLGDLMRLVKIEPGSSHAGINFDVRRPGTTPMTRGDGQLRRLLEMKRTYPSAPFLAAVEQALRFGLFDLGRLEALILKQVAGEFFNLDAEAPDDA